MADLTYHGPVEASMKESPDREPPIEDDMELLDIQTKQLSELMLAINKTRNRIYEKRMRLGEKEEFIVNNITKILHGENQGEVAMEPRRY